MIRLPKPNLAGRFFEGIVFWVLHRLPAWMVADYASDVLEMYDLDSARDIMADAGQLRREAMG